MLVDAIDVNEAALDDANEVGKTVDYAAWTKGYTSCQTFSVPQETTL